MSCVPNVKISGVYRSSKDLFIYKTAIFLHSECYKCVCPEETEFMILELAPRQENFAATIAYIAVLGTERLGWLAMYDEVWETLERVL